VKPSVEQAYEEHAEPLFRYLRRLSGSRPLAEDCLQETFLKLHEFLRRGGTVVHLRAWLFRVGTNAVHDRVRTADRAMAREQRTVPGPVVVDISERLEQRQLILSALRSIPTRMRQVLLLSAEGFSYKDIAGIAGIEQGYVGVMLHRARSAFARQLEAANGQNVRRQDRNRVR
jgi:RNA polymerase sigma factor (sigma-70 family)